MNSNNQIYIPHSALDGLPVKLTLIKIWDENNILMQQIDDSLRYEKEHFLIQTQITVNGQIIFTSQEFKFLKKNQAHEEQIIYPIFYKDLSFNSLITITIFSIMKSFDEQSPLASTTFALFDENMKLRMGKQNLILWPNVAADISFDSKTPGLVIDRNIDSLNFCTQKIEQYDKYDQPLQNQDHTNHFFAINNLKLKLLYCYKTIPSAFIEIDLPRFPHPVLFEDIEYQYDETELSLIGGGFNMQNLAQVGNGLFTNPNQPPTKLLQQTSQKIFIPNQQMGFSDCFQISDYESELNRSDPVTDMILTVYREEKNPESSKPNPNEINQLKKLIKLPQINDLQSNEAALIWRYRYWLLQYEYSDSLPKFLNSAKWGEKLDEDEAMKLLNRWGTIKMEDAIYLLSNFSSSNELFTSKTNKKPIDCMKQVRNFAVKNLELLDDQQIQNILLQLVSALKYDVIDIGESSLSKFLFSRAIRCKDLASLIFWYLNVEKNFNPKEGKTQVTEWYTTLFMRFDEILKEQGNEEICELIRRQSQFRDKMLQLSDIRNTRNLSRAQQVEKLKEKLNESYFQDSNEFPQHYCCLNMKYKLIRVVPEKAKIFSSAMAPMRFTFEAQSSDGNDRYSYLFKNGDDLRQDQLVMQIFRLMDELLKGVHQDMKLLPYSILACSKSDGFLEFIEDSETIQDVLKSGSVSSYLKAISENTENKFYFKELELIGKNIKDPINQTHIKNYIETNVKKQPMGIHHKIMQNYLLSSAGYCVMTYFLGVGDRHLENLMINNEGKMFHIDFGFILGKDPKPWPPPFKLCKEMVEGMGGEKTEFYTNFKQKCIDVYLYLRKHAKLIISLMQLMADAGIKDYSQIAMQNMYQKFRLDDTDESAEIHFLGIVEESVRSIFSDYTDIVHKYAAYFRK